MSENVLHLQSIGNVPAIPLSEVKVGDTLVWNYGSKSIVTAIHFITPKTIELTTSYGDNKTFTCRKRSATLVCKR